MAVSYSFAFDCHSRGTGIQLSQTHCLRKPIFIMVCKDSRRSRPFGGAITGGGCHVSLDQVFRHMRRGLLGFSSNVHLFKLERALMCLHFLPIPILFPWAVSFEVRPHAPWKTRSNARSPYHGSGPLKFQQEGFFFFFSQRNRHYIA